MKKQRLIVPVLALAVIVSVLLIGTSGCAKQTENENTPVITPEEIDEVRIPERTDAVQTDHVMPMDPADLPIASPNPTETAVQQAEPTPGDPTDHQPASSVNPVETAEAQTPGFTDPVHTDPTPDPTPQEGGPNTDTEVDPSYGDLNEGELDP